MRGNIPLRSLQTALQAVRSCRSSPRAAAYFRGSSAPPGAACRGSCVLHPPPLCRCWPAAAAAVARCLPMNPDPPPPPLLLLPPAAPSNPPAALGAHLLREFAAAAVHIINQLQQRLALHLLLPHVRRRVGEVKGEGAEVQLAGKQRLPLACRGVAQQRQRVCEVAEEGRRRRRRWRRCLKRSGSAPDPLPTPAAPPFTPDLHGTVPAAAPTCILPPHLLWRERRQHVPLVGGRRRRSRLRASRPVGAPRAGVGWRARMLLPAGGAQSARGLPLRRAGAPLAGLAAGARCRGQLGLHLPQPVDRWRWGGHRGVRRGSSCRAGACARSSRPPAALGVFQRLTWRVGLCQSVQEAGRRGDGQEHSRKGVKSAGSSREAGQQHRQREQQRVRASGVAWPQMGAPTAATGFADVLAALACLLGVLARACIASTSSDHRSLHHHGLTSALRCRLSFRTAPSRKFVELRPLQGLIQASHGLTQQ